MRNTNPVLARREMMAATLASMAVTALPASAAAAKAAPTPGNRFKAMIGQFAEEIMRLAPEIATGLGMDTGARTGLKSKLADGSPAGQARWAAQVASMLARLGTVRRDQLPPADRITYDTVSYAARQGMAGTKFFYGGAAGGFYGGATPYAISQQGGAVSETPEFLNAQHLIKTGADAESYLVRAAAMGRKLDEETARMSADAARGVVPPNFIAAKTLSMLGDYRKKAAANQGLVTSLVDRAAKAGIKGDWQKRATAIVEQILYPALDRQIAAFRKATASATDVAGVHRLPDGEAFYRYGLKLGTTTDLSPQEIHTIGQEQNRAIQSRMDAILKSQGMTQGGVGERLQALNQDPAQQYPDTQAGRERILAYCNERVALQRGLLSKVSHMKLKAPLVIKRVPEDIQAGASLGYMNFASLDGSRPAIYYINLKSTALWPKYQLATLTAHEGIPGHAWQGAYLAENASKIPLITSLMGFNAFIEGWALYAEQLCDEAGLYDADPLSQLGYLQAQQFRACRLVVDTGLHALRWTREQSIRFLVDNTGRGEAAMTSETDRYCVSPGQACGYKVGHNEILRLRDRAKAALGEGFDLGAFNDAIVQTGGVPLTVLGSAVDAYLAMVREPS
ncbi:MAG: hypothetical protein RL367_2179 [Pseudomonadota bacterium]|jgi:uncharacterized protein (DUF885 family)